MGNIFGKRKKESQVTEQDKAVLQLKQQRDKIKVYQKKIDLQLEKYRVTAKELLKDGKKEKANLLLRKIKFRESLLQKTDALLENIERMIEVQVVQGLKNGNEALHKIHQIKSIEIFERIMEETQEAVNYQREIDDILAGGLTAEDEDDVLKELDQIIQESLPEAPTDELLATGDASSIRKPSEVTVEDKHPGFDMAAMAIKVVLTEDDHTFTLDEEALEEVLLDPRVRDKKVVVVSVAGAYRNGKSFLLDFFLRYLYAKGAPDWLGDPDSPLKGFPWKGGSERNTSGILLWSEPFEVTLPSGEKVCVLLMDTQGAFDSQSTVKDCATVFALSTMISSVQVYNIMGNIQEDDLQHLELFTEYGRLAMEESKTKPFQHLHFLVRDWPYPYEYDFGSGGGDQILEKRLQTIDGQHEELTQLRRHLRNCFEHISCYLMPHPGLDVATNPQFDGRLADIEDDFKTHVQQFVSSLLSPEHLVVKEINGSMLTGKELIEYFRAYVKVYQGNELPEPKSMLQATAEANNLAAVANAKDLYAKEMEKVCGGDKPYLSPEILRQEHERCQTAAMKQFNSIRKMGGEEFSHEYSVRLDVEIESHYDDLLKHNAAKNVYSGIQTPVVLFSCALACYVVSGLLGLLGLEFLANVFNLVLFAMLGVAGFWVYTRASGNFADTGATIDGVASHVHKMFFSRATLPAELMAGDAKKKQ